jgi:hypothetical protein
MIQFGRQAGKQNTLNQGVLSGVRAVQQQAPKAGCHGTCITMQLAQACIALC